MILCVFKSSYPLFTSVDRSRQHQELFSICLFCWIGFGSVDKHNTSRHIFLVGPCDDICNPIIYVAAPVSRISKVCCILLERAIQGLSNAVENFEISLGVSEKSHFEISQFPTCTRFTAQTHTGMIPTVGQTNAAITNTSSTDRAHTITITRRETENLCLI